MLKQLDASVQYNLVCMLEPTQSCKLASSDIVASIDTPQLKNMGGGRDKATDSAYVIILAIRLPCIMLKSWRNLGIRNKHFLTSR